MEIVKLRERSNKIQLTVEEALQGALDSEFRKDKVLVLLYDKNKGYEFWQGGGISVEETLWHLEQYKIALLEGRIDELD